MNRDELVDAIIREVKNVLALRGVTVAPSTPSYTAGKKARGISVPSKSVQTVKNTQSVGSSDLTGKQIITQKDLEGHGGKSITVRKNAVITPLAYDYAREKDISLNKVEQPVVSGGSAGKTQSVINVSLAVAPDFPGDSSVVKQFLQSKGFNVKEITGKSHEAAVSSLGTSVSSGTSDFGICIERTGMEAPIYANRNKKIRAVHCRETLDARAARVDLGANVIVIDSLSNPEAVISGFIGD